MYSGAVSARDRDARALNEGWSAGTRSTSRATGADWRTAGQRDGTTGVRGRAHRSGLAVAADLAERRDAAGHSPPRRPAGFGLPNLRRNVCPHFYMTGARGAIPIQAPHLLKALIRQDPNVSRCQLRGGVHLDQGYVNDVCLTPRFNQCVFYEDELTRE